MAKAPRSRLRRAATGCAVGLLALPGVSALGVLGVAGWLSTDSGGAWLRDTVQDAANDAITGGSLDVESVHVGLDGRLVLRGVDLHTDDGRTVIGARRIAARVSLPELLDKRLHLTGLRGNGVVVDLDMGEDGVLDLMRLFGQTEPSPPSDEPWGGLPLPIEVDSALLKGVSVRYSSAGEQVIDLVADGALAVHGEGARVVVDVGSLGAVLTDQGPLALHAAGQVVYTGDTVDLSDLVVRLPGGRLTANGAVDLTGEMGLDLTLDVDPLDLAAIDPVAGSPGLRGLYAGQLVAKGPLSELVVAGNLAGRGRSRGELSVAAVVDLVAEELSWKASLGLTQVRVDDVYDVGGALMLDGLLELEGRGTSWPDGIVVDGTFSGKGQDLYGMELEELALGIHLERGQLSIVNLDLLGIIGRVRSVGGLDLQTGRLDQHVTGRIDLSRLAKFGVTGLTGYGPIDVRVTGDVFAPGAPIHVEGTVTVGPMAYGTDATFETVRASFVVDVEGDHTHVVTDVEATGGLASGVSIATVRVTGMDVDVDPRRTLVDVPELVAAAISLPDTLSIAGLTGGVKATVPASGPMDVAVGLNLGPVQVIDRHRATGGTATVTLRGDDLGFTVDLAPAHAGELPFLGVAGEMNLATSEIALQRLELSPTPGIALTGRGVQRLTLVDGGASGVELSLAGERGAIRVNGDLGTTGDLDGTAVIEGLDLALISELQPEVGALSGTLDASIAARGPVRDPSLTAIVDVRQIAVPDTVSGVDLHLEGSLAAGVVDTTLRVGREEEPLATAWLIMPLDLEGELPALDPGAEVDLQFTVPAGSLERFAPVLVGQDIPAGVASARLEVAGPLRDPQVRVRAVSELEVATWDRPARIELDVERVGAELAWWVDVREGFDQLGSTVGTASNRLHAVIAAALGEGPAVDPEDYGVYADDFDASIVMLGLPVDQMAAAAGAEMDIGGTIVGGFTVEGRWFEPQIAGAINWLDAKLGAATLDGGYVSMEHQDSGGYLLDALVTFGGSEPGTVSVLGNVPLDIDLREDSATWTEGELDLVLTGEQIPLSLVEAFDSGVQDAVGVIALDGTISGTLDNLVPAVDLLMEDGSLVYLPTGVHYKDIAVDVRADESALTVHRMQLRTEPINTGLGRLVGATEGNKAAQKPSMVMAGSILLADGAPSAVDVSMSLTDAWLLATTDERLRLGGNIRAVGKWDDEITVSTRKGDELTLSSGLMVLDAAAFLSTGALELDKVLQVHRGATAADAVAVDDLPDEPSVLDRITLDIGVDLVRALGLQVAMPYIDDLGSLGAAVTRADMTARLGGVLSVKSKIASPQVLGEVEIIEGQVRVLQSQFELEEGKVSFVGGDYANPVLDLDARMDVTGGSIEMRISGTPTAPDIALSSTEYPDQTQILTILLTGRSPDDMSESQGSSTAGALAGLLLNSVIGGSRLGSFSLDPDGSVRVVLPPVAPNVFAESVVKTTAGIDENRFAFDVEWAILRRLVLEASYGNVDKSVDLFWELRF